MSFVLSEISKICYVNFLEFHQSDMFFVVIVYIFAIVTVWVGG